MEEVRMPVDLKLPWRVEDKGFGPRVVSREGKPITNTVEVLEAVVAAMNATQRSDCKRCGGVCGYPFSRCEPPRDHSGCLGCFRSNRECVCGGRFGVDDDGGLTKWYATLDDAWANMGPGKRIVTR